MRVMWMNVSIRVMLMCTDLLGIIVSNCRRVALTPVKLQLAPNLRHVRRRGFVRG